MELNFGASQKNRDLDKIGDLEKYYKNVIKEKDDTIDTLKAKVRKLESELKIYKANIQSK